MIALLDQLLIRLEAVTRQRPVTLVWVCDASPSGRLLGRNYRSLCDTLRLRFGDDAFDSVGSFAEHPCYRETPGARRVWLLHRETPGRPTPARGLWAQTRQGLVRPTDPTWHWLDCFPDDPIRRLVVQLSAEGPALPPSTPPPLNDPAIAIARRNLETLKRWTTPPEPAAEPPPAFRVLFAELDAEQGGDHG